MDEELKFDVASVAASGHLFAQFSEAQLEKKAGGPVGIDIFISKEELLARDKEAQAGASLVICLSSFLFLSLPLFILICARSCSHSSLDTLFLNTLAVLTSFFHTVFQFLQLSDSFVLFFTAF